MLPIVPIVKYHFKMKKEGKKKERKPEKKEWEKRAAPDLKKGVPLPHRSFG